MEQQDIKVGRCYEAKNPSINKSSDEYNDRLVYWISPDRKLVQYDSPTISIGRHLPTTTMDKFLKWVGRDITELMPKDGSWRMIKYEND